MGVGGAPGWDGAPPASSLSPAVLCGFVTSLEVGAADIQTSQKLSGPASGSTQDEGLQQEGPGPQDKLVGRGEGLKGLPWVPEDQAQAAGLRPAGWRSPHVRDVIRTKEKMARTLPGKRHQRRSWVGTKSPEGPQEPWGTSSPALRPLGPQPSCSFPPARYPLSRDPGACRPLHQSLPLCILEAHPDQPAPDTPGPLRDQGSGCTCVSPPDPWA